MNIGNVGAVSQYIPQVKSPAAQVSSPVSKAVEEQSESAVARAQENTTVGGGINTEA
jgi:hypothetical protein